MCLFFGTGGPFVMIFIIWVLWLNGKIIMQPEFKKKE